MAKCFAILFVILISGFHVFSQKGLEKIDINKLLNDTSEEYSVHLKSIFNSNSIYNKDDSLFILDVIKYYLTDSSDLAYISNKNLLPEIKPVFGNESLIQFKDTIQGDVYEIEICKSFVDTLKYEIEEFSPVVYPNIGTINNLNIYGKYGKNFSKNYQISKLTVKINNKELLIPEEAYLNLLSPNFGKAPKWYRSSLLYCQVYAYTSLDKDYLYLYIWGGHEGFEIYYAKLIFDKDRFIKKIVIDYMTISQNSGFRPDFIGF